VYTGFGGKDWGKEIHLESTGVDGKITLIYVFKKLDGGMGWIDLAQD
jgi:hypothetical protein